MPELPEVETTLRGIRPFLEGVRIDGVTLRVPKLRWEVPRDLPRRLTGETVLQVSRRGKYLLLTFSRGTLLVHLGMSGRLSLVPTGTPAGRHDHVDFCLAGGRCLRFTDPRRFGALLWTTADPLQHPLLAELGPEPLEEGFTAAYLLAASRGRRVAVKPWLMASRTVVGVGNIYASEALFRAKIHPALPAGQLTAAQCKRLAQAVRTVLQEAIAQGGTTLQDFLAPDGSSGYFRVSLQVYGREGEACPLCGTAIRCERHGQRSSYFCPRCQRS